MTLDAPEIPLLRSVAELGNRYAAWLVDIWGVMHDGLRAHKEAVAATRAFRAQGGVVVLLSNSPRRSLEVRAQLRSLGVPDDAYDATVTSGDLTRAELEKRPGARVFHLGPERDAPTLAGLPITLTGQAEADLVVCTGLFEDEVETPADYETLLGNLAARKLPMICANPDLQVERGNQLIYCAGALAALYEEKGGEVVYAGKPHAPIYRLAFDAVKQLAGREVRHDEILAIGDGIGTDMAGAAKLGLDALFIVSGLSMSVRQKAAEGVLDGHDIARLFRGRPQPLAAMLGLR